MSKTKKYIPPKEERESKNRKIHHHIKTSMVDEDPPTFIKIRKHKNR
jgi:hypothetical protein